jgi:hypothetical protein
VGMKLTVRSLKAMARGHATAEPELCNLHFEQDSVTILGLQIADLVAHARATMSPAAGRRHNRGNETTVRRPTRRRVRYSYLRRSSEEDWPETEIDAKRFCPLRRPVPFDTVLKGMRS